MVLYTLLRSIMRLTVAWDEDLGAQSRLPFVEILTLLPDTSLMAFMSSLIPKMHVPDRHLP